MMAVHTKRRAALLSTAMAMAVLFTAGILKAIDVPSFLESLVTWRLLPLRALPFISFALPAIELGISLAWFLNIRRRLMVWCALTLFSSFTLLYALHVALVGPPDCACLGVLKLEQQADFQAIILIARNSLLIVALLFGVFFMKNSGGRHDSNSPPESIATVPLGNSAFTP